MEIWSLGYVFSDGHTQSGETKDQCLSLYRLYLAQAVIFILYHFQEDQMLTKWRRKLLEGNRQHIREQQLIVSFHIT